YACLIPLFGTPATSMRNGCPTSEESPVREFCDAFKTLTVPNSSDSYVASDDQAFSPDASAFSFQLLNRPATNRLTYSHPDQSPPRDVLLKTTVLRLCSRRSSLPISPLERSSGRTEFCPSPDAPFLFWSLTAGY